MERAAWGAFLARVVQNRARNARREVARRGEREERVARQDRLEPESEALERLELILRGLPGEELGSLRPTLDRQRSSTRELELEDGRLVAHGVASGAWALRLRNSPYCVPDREVEVRSGETTRVVLDAAPGQEVRLSCHVGGSADWRELEVELREPGGDLVRREGPIGRSQADEDRIRLYGLTLAEGTYAVEAWTDAGQRGQATLVVERGARAELVVEVR